MAEGWKRSGLSRGVGIPAPSGRYGRVGCVDLMHKFEGESDGLLVRLFYPTAAEYQRGRYEFANWRPHERYAKVFLDFYRSSAAGLNMRAITAPKVPALYGAPFISGQQASVPEAQPPAPVPQSTSGEGVKSEPTPADDEGVNDQATNQKAGSTPAGDERVNDQAASATSSQFHLFPIIVFSHGLWGMRTVYSGICSDFASHGYIVASVEHRDRSACLSMRRVPRPGGAEGQYQDDWLEFYHRPETEKEFPLRNRQVYQRADDAKKALDLLHLLNDGADVHNMMEGEFDFKQFQGSMDMETVAVMGHSFGGSTTIQTLSEDPRFKCGIALDCWMVPIHRDLYGAGIQQPLLFINSSDDFQWVENVQRMMKLSKPPDENGISSCQVLTIRGTNHYNQTDLPFLFALRWRIYASQLDPNTAFTVNNDICLTFLKRHLLKDPGFQTPIPNLDGGEGHSEHIIFGTNLDLSKPPEGEDREGGQAGQEQQQEQEREEQEEENGAKANTGSDLDATGIRAKL